MNRRLTAPGAAAMLAALALLAVPGCSSGGSTSGPANAATAFALFAVIDGPPDDV